MKLTAFTDGASKGNPGDAGAGYVIFDDKKEEVARYCEYLGKKTNNEAEYIAIVRALDKMKVLGSKYVNIFSDSQLLVRQMQGKYEVKSKKIKVIYDMAKAFEKDIEVKYVWIPREENKIADSLANKGIIEKNSFNNNSVIGSLKLDKSFFGKINCLKIQVNSDNDIYFHMGILNAKSNQWIWEKVKMSDIEIGEIIHLLKMDNGKCSFFHSFDTKKTQIWCTKSETSFSIKIGVVSKNFSIGEFEVLRVLLEQCIIIKNFS